MPHLMFGFYAGIVFLFFSTLNSFQMGALWGLESYRTLSVASATSGLATLLIVAVAVWKFGLAGAFVAMSAGAVIRWALHARTLRTALRTHGISFERIHLRSAVPVVLRFALPSALCGCISLPAMWIAQALLARQTDGFSYVGTYAAANNIRLLVLFLPQVLNTVGVSILNNHRHQAPAMYRLVHRSNVIAMALTNLTVALLAAFACRPLLGLFGKNFAGDASILLILLASTVPESISMGLHQHIQAQERMWQVFLAINLPREGLVLSAAFFLVPTHGAQGLAISYLLGALLALIAYTLLVRQNDRAPAIGQLETS
jgi:O-antigen/teichoic acid export membrane protein